MSTSAGGAGTVARLSVIRICRWLMLFSAAMTDGMAPGATSQDPAT